MPGAGGGRRGLKPGADDAVLHPATASHRVAEVTRGGASGHGDPGAEPFDLDAARRASFERDGKGPAFDPVSKAHAASMRRWAEP